MHKNRRNQDGQILFTGLYMHISRWKTKHWILKRYSGEGYHPSTGPNKSHRCGQFFSFTWPAIHDAHRTKKGHIPEHWRVLGAHTHTHTTLCDSCTAFMLLSSVTPLSWWFKWLKFHFGKQNSLLRNIVNRCKQNNSCSSAIYQV